MRLIDADNYKGKVIASNCYSGVNKLINIDDVPTAFDIDKVVQELEELKEDSRKYWENFDDEDSFGSMNAYTKAIEIVKRGGLNE